MDVFHKISKVVTTLAIVVAVVLAILLAGVRLIGLTPYTVLSGSMEPTYHVGSLVYVQQVDPTALTVGDPITFSRQSGLVVTHRIIEVVQENGQLAFRTQGDANNTPDGSAVPAQYVIGRPAFSIPVLGYISNFVQNPPGIFIVVGVLLVLIILSFIPEEKTHDSKIEDSTPSEN